MESELWSHRDCLAQLTAKTFEMFKVGEIIFGLGQCNIALQMSSCLEYTHESRPLDDQPEIKDIL